MSILLKSHNSRVLVSEYDPHFVTQEFKPREKISGISMYSKARLSQLLCSFEKFPFKIFVTLTFKNKPSAKTAKRELDTFCKNLNRRKIGYLWVMELQNKFHRDSIHFHFLLTTDFWDCADLEKTWGNGFVKVGSILHESGIRRYLLKEISKENQKTTEKKLGRWWGVSRWLNKKYLLGVYDDSLIIDLVDSCGVKPLYWRKDSDKLGLDLNLTAKK